MLVGGNTAAEACGSSQPNRLGPSMMPASISPTTWGWFNRAKTSPISRLRVRISPTCTSSSRIRS